MNRKHEWTEAEDEELRMYFPEHRTIDVANYLGVNEGQAYSRAKVLGIRKSPAYKELEKQRAIEMLLQHGSAHRFKKGTEPPNKGKKMPEEIKAKVAHTFFKKGHVPQNAKYDGHERWSGRSGEAYIMIRVAPNKYVHKQRHIWEQANGPVPDDMLVIFKDGNRENFDIDNLALISKADNIRRNAIYNYPTELQQTIRLLNKLNNRIHAKKE